MTLAGIKTMLETTGMPVVYGAWKKGTAPPMPYIVYLCTYNNNFGADGAVYFYSGHVQIELYTKEKNIEAEAALESAMSEIFWTKTETYLESEKCWQVLYEIEV